MNLSKDECRILAAAINDYKYRLADEFYIDNLMLKLDDLELKLESNSKDNRRKGRTSEDDFTDLLKRFSLNKHS